MKLVIFGDSWAFGADLEDRVNTNYASHLKTMMGATEVINMAKPGIGNAAITLQLLSWLSQPGALEDDPFIVIGWTSPERAEVFFDYTVSQVPESTPYWTTLGPWILTENWCDNDSSPYRPKYHKHVEFYYTMMRNELSCYVEWIQQLMLVEGLLQNKNIPFHMHQAIYYNQHFVTNHEKFMHWRDGPVNTEDMWNTLSPDTFLHKDKLDDMSLYGYLKEHKLGNPKLVDLPFMNPGLGDHPNEYGHQLIAELLYNDMKEKGII